MRIAFFGSPDFVVPILSHLDEEFGVSLVVTQPDKPVGRKGTLTPTPVKQYARDKNIPILTPDSLKGFMFPEKIDLAIVAAYGLIIPQPVLDQPTFGFINIHYSLLPKYRGASPVQSAILAGEKTTGTTIMKMDEELDHGEIIHQQEVAIEQNDTSESLLDKLNQASLPLLNKTLQTVEETGKLPELTKQDHSKGTFTRRLTKDDGFIEFSSLQKSLNGEHLIETDLPKLQQEIFKAHNTEYRILNTHAIHDFIRALYPWPGAWTLLPNGKRLKLLSSRLVHHPEGVQATEGSGGKLALLEVQLEGKQRTRNTNFLKDLL